MRSLSIAVFVCVVYVVTELFKTCYFAHSLSQDACKLIGCAGLLLALFVFVHENQDAMAVCVGGVTVATFVVIIANY